VITTEPAVPPPRWRAPSKPETPTLFVLVFAAIPSRSDGDRPVVVFAQGSNLEGALRRSLDGLAADGWREPELQGAKTLSNDPTAEPDEMARGAIVRALEFGFAYLAYR
jgi:hypothetical protein